MRTASAADKRGPAETLTHERNNAAKTDASDFIWRDKAEPPLVAASVGKSGNCFIKSNVDFTAASGWLERLVRLHRAEASNRYKSLSLSVRFIKSFEGNWSSSTFRAVATPATGSFRGSKRSNWTRSEAWSQ